MHSLNDRSFSKHWNTLTGSHPLGPPRRSPVARWMVPNIPWAPFLRHPSLHPQACPGHRSMWATRQAVGDDTPGTSLSQCGGELEVVPRDPSVFAPLQWAARGCASQSSKRRPPAPQHTLPGLSSLPCLASGLPHCAPRDLFPSTRLVPASLSQGLL